jgi:phage terminase large subunit-like protein
VFDKAKAERAVKFIENLKHTKGIWFGEKFVLLPWQKEIIEKVFGTVDKNGYRQYQTVYIEIPKKNGKTELASGVGLKCLCADNEMGAEVYSAAVDREQAGFVYNVASKMVGLNHALSKRCRVIDSRKRIVVYKTNSFYQVLSADVKSKHGVNRSCLIFDELHALDNYAFWDTLTYDSGIARTQPLLFIITTAGYDRESICYKQHDYAIKVRDGIIKDDTFLPIIYAADPEDDWTDEDVWKKVNPSLGITIGIEDVREACKKAQEIPYEENLFRRFRLNQWVSQLTRWISLDKWDATAGIVNEERLKGRDCFGGLDLSSTSDITAFVLTFPPENYILPFFFIPEDNMREREHRDKVPYSSWVKQGFINATPGNVIDYTFIERKIDELARRYVIKEIAFDRWNADMLVQRLMGKNMTMVETGLGHSSMSAPTKYLETLIYSKKIIHGGNPVLRWMFDNVMMEQDAAGNIKPSKKKSTEKIDGIVALILALSRSMEQKDSVYDTRGIRTA